MYQIIWGPSAKLTAENLKIQEKRKAMQADGVVIEACIVCADAYGVDDELKNWISMSKAWAKTPFCH